MKLRDILERFLLTALTFLLFTFFRDRLGLIRPEDYLVLIGVLVSLYFVIVPSLLWLSGATKNKFNKLVPKIGILNGYIKDASREHKCVPKAANVSGIIWESALKKALKGVRLKRIKRLYADKIDNSFALIVNPYGENYPESDTDLRTTFQRIRAYLSNGGIFFTSGAPFWHHQNTVTETDGHWSVVKTTNDVQNMTDGLCYKALGISVTMQENEPLEVGVYQGSMEKEIEGSLLDGPTKLKRWRAILPQTPDCLPIIREVEDSSYPICFVQYDKGFLLHSGLWVTNEDSAEFQLLIQVISALISQKFSQLKG